MKYRVWVVMFLALPMMTTAAPVIDPVEEVACVVMVTPTSGDRFRIDDVESRFSYATAGECQQDLLEFDVLPGDTVTIDDVPGDADQYEIPFSIGATSNSASASLLLHYYGEDAVELDSDVVTDESSDTNDTEASTEAEREALKVTIMTQMVSVMQRIIYLFSLL